MALSRAKAQKKRLAARIWEMSDKAIVNMRHTITR